MIGGEYVFYLDIDFWPNAMSSFIEKRNVDVITFEGKASSVK